MLGYTSTVIKEVPAGGENGSRCYAKQEYPNSRTKKKQKLAVESPKIFLISHPPH